MTVVSVKFKGRGKTYYFDPNGLDVAVGERVVVETSKGLELCDCVQGNHEVNDARIVPPLRCVVRKATPDDLRIAELCKAREKEAFGICEKKIADHGLDMKLVDVECAFDGSKMLFFFTSDGRVDFRELVRDLAGVFRTRIELRQIGVRDEAKMLGGIGMCGRPYCCNQFLNDFAPVSTKMAKTQSLSLNPTKISGSCGRLMCCLRYEQEAYEDLVKTVPKLGAFVETQEGYGNVTQVNLLRQSVKVRLDGGDDSAHLFPADEVAAVPGGRPKPGEPLPHVLVIKEKPKEEPEEPERDYWTAPPIFAEDTLEQQPAKAGDGDRNGKRRRSRGRGGKKPAEPGAQAKPEAKPAKAEAKPVPAKPHEQPEEGEAAQQKKNRSRHRGGRGRGGENQPKAERAQAPKPEQAQTPKSDKPQQPRPEKPRPERPQQKQAQSAPRPKNEDGGQPKKPNNRRGRGRGGKPKPPAEGSEN